MSTRTNIVIEYGESRVYLYRHHDGYLAGTGADLARALVASGNDANRFLRSLIEQAYEQQSYETEPKRVYELTSAIHGDIEYLYRVSFGEYGSVPLIGYGARVQLHQVRLGSIEEFATAVNAEIRAQNRRLGELRRKQPGAYGEATDEPELNLGVAS